MKQCIFCGYIGKITRHHLIPRFWRRKLAALPESKLPDKYKGLDLARAVRCCRVCHDAIHYHIEDSDLAENYYNENLLWNHEGLRLFFKMRKEELQKGVNRGEDV